MQTFSVFLIFEYNVMYNKKQVIKMKILCKNMTHAMKANKLLYNCGIHSKVEKSTDNPGIKGCVYGISFNDKYFDKAIDAMKKGEVHLHKQEKNYYGDDLL